MGDALKRYFQIHRLITYEAGELILHANTACNDVLFIERGIVKAYDITDCGDCKLAALKGPLDIVPIEVLFTDEQNTLFYQALTKTAVRAAPKQAFQEAIMQNSELSNAALENTIAVTRRYTRRLRNLELKSARSRIIFRLIDLLKSFGHTLGNNANAIVAPLNHEDLAEATNTTRDTANREVSKLAKEGLLQKKRGLIIVPDLTKLEAQLS
jgi:CRP-like cAMP-binding protein